MFYKHFTSEERNELSALLRAGLKQCKIARQLGKSPGAISGEIKRNSTNGKYDARYAKLEVRERRVSANERFRKLEHNPWLRSYIVRKLKKHWSSEQIEGRLKKEYPCSREKQIGKDSIYKYIHNERKDLAKYLRCKKGRYRRRYGTRIREKQREEEKNIHILTHVERRSGYLFADKLERATAEITKRKTIARFETLPEDKKFTITYDNGSTFSEYESTEKETGLDIYFAYPYHSWERGCNENANGLLREFFPKKSKFANIEQEAIEKAVRLINNRPRKRHNYLTPYEVFHNRKI